MKKVITDIEQLNDGDNLTKTLSRSEFEELDADLFRKKVIVNNVIRDEILSKREIDDIVLADESTQMTKIQQMVHDFFDGKELKINYNPDEGDPFGTAIEGTILSRKENVYDFL